MGITKGQLRKLGFKKKAHCFGLSDDFETLVYKEANKRILVFLPKGKTTLFVSFGYDNVTGSPSTVERLVMLDEVGLFEFQKFLKSLKNEDIMWPSNRIID